MTNKICHCGHLGTDHKKNSGHAPCEIKGCNCEMFSETILFPKREYSHYFKKSGFEYIDVYRVLQLFEVSDPCVQHAVKKLLAAGKRGAKDSEKDVKEAIVSLNRWLEMRSEECSNVV